MLLDHDRELLVQMITKIRDLDGKSLDKFTKDIIYKKRQKFLCDKIDFEQGHMYKWSHKGNRRPIGNRNPSNTYSDTNNTSDDFLSSDQSDTDTGPKGAKEQTNNRNKIDTRDKTQEGQSNPGVVTPYNRVKRWTK